MCVFCSVSRLYLLQPRIPIKYGAFIVDNPIIAATAAERFDLGANEPRVHDLGEEVVSLAEMRQKRFIAVRFVVPGEGQPMR